MITQVRNYKGWSQGTDRGQEVTDVKAGLTGARDRLHLGGVLNGTSRRRLRLIGEAEGK